MRPLDRRLRGSILLVLMLSMVACAGENPSATADPGKDDPTAASSGLCEARHDLPDVAAARRAFTDLAHEALHRLAADTRLSRAMAAAILESMERSEADLSHAPSAAELATDLDALQAATDAALTTLGEAVPTCAG